jgi:uncharacterized protein (TIGR00251 family)
MISPTKDGIQLRVRVQARTSRSEVVGQMGDSLKVRLAASPVDGAANSELVKIVAKRLGVPRASVSIVHGLSSRSKILRVSGIDVQEAYRRLGS